MADYRRDGVVVYATHGVLSVVVAVVVVVVAGCEAGGRVSVMVFSCLQKLRCTCFHKDNYTM